MLLVRAASQEIGSVVATALASRGVRATAINSRISLIANLLCDGRPPRPSRVLLLVGVDCQAVRKTRTTPSVLYNLPLDCGGRATRDQGLPIPPRGGGNAVGNRRSHRGCRAIKMDIWRRDPGCATWGRRWTATRRVRLPVSGAHVDPC